MSVLEKVDQERENESMYVIPYNFDQERENESMFVIRIISIILIHIIQMILSTSTEGLVR